MRHTHRLYIIGGASAIGYFLGSSMGLALQGTAINFGFTLGAVFGIFAFISTRNKGEIDSKIQLERTDTSTPIESQEVASSGFDDANLNGLFKVLEGFYRKTTDALIFLWNAAMDLFLAIGLMPILQKLPWLFAVTGIVLLAIAFPLGVAYVVVAIAAFSRGPTKEKNFKV